MAISQLVQWENESQTVLGFTEIFSSNSPKIKWSEPHEQHNCPCFTHHAYLLLNHLPTHCESDNSRADVWLCESLLTLNYTTDIKTHITALVEDLFNYRPHWSCASPHSPSHTAVCGLHDTIYTTTDIAVQRSASTNTAL